MSTLEMVLWAVLGLMLLAVLIFAACLIIGGRRHRESDEAIEAAERAEIDAHFAGVTVESGL